jgi:glycosyltransferase involved in cell wall biosynthesis
MKWGDFHFGRSLSKYLTRLGQEVSTQYDPGWDDDAPCDVVLVLRGKYPFPPGDIHRGALRVIWNISHPADVPIDEYRTYDLVCVASRPWAEGLQAQIDVPVVPLLQCTDLEEFRTPRVDDIGLRRDIVFIGNTRDIERPVVSWALEYGLPLKIWGRGWDRWSAGGHVVADYLPNEELGDLYARSRATLNDHWDDMKEYGFVNNRIFDAIACGLPVISDWHSELHTMFPRGILLYRNKGEFVACIEELLLDYPSVFEQVRQLGVRVRDEFSFERRAADLVRAVDGLRSS